MPEFIHPDDFGALARASKAAEASQAHLDYLMRRLCDKYNIGLRDAIEKDGSITRDSTEG